jgi:hypothetical protein
MDPRRRHGAAAAKPWLHGEFDTFVHIQAVQARLLIKLGRHGEAQRQSGGSDTRHTA